MYMKVLEIQGLQTTNNQQQTTFNISLQKTSNTNGRREIIEFFGGDH